MTTSTTDHLPKPIERSAPMKVTGRLKHAVDLMVWKGLTRDQAAEEAGLKTHSLYVAFRKPHVRAHYLAELGALRTSAKAKNFHHLEKIAAESGNDMARVAAVKTMEAIDDEEGAGRSLDPRHAPGVTIIIRQATPTMVDVTPTRPARIEHQDDQNPIFRRDR